MAIVLSQYAELIATRRQKVEERSNETGRADMRTGWLLWQESLRQFLYFEEEMLAPNLMDYEAEWRVTTGGKARKTSTNLWVYEKETGIKRFSVTNQAGAKIQPYFDVPAANDPNLCIWTVISKHIAGGDVRLWTTEATARELERLLGNLDTSQLSKSILRVAASLSTQGPIEQASIEVARPLTISSVAYAALQEALPGVSDEHSLQLLAQTLREQN